MNAHERALALNGGPAVRQGVLPYGRQALDEADVQAVAEVLRSDWLITGPALDAFERSFVRAVGAREAVSFSNGTAALHGAMAALGVHPGDEVIVPPLTFAASANCVVYQGGTPVFADVEPGTLLLDPARVAPLIGPRTKAIVAVDYAGQPCDYGALGALARDHGLALVADACHALGACEGGRPVGALAELNTFSFHPVKHIACGEGGMVTTDDAQRAAAMRRFRNHGITTDHRQRERQGSWFYEMVELGFNYRLSDIQCALGLSQLGKLQAFVDRRRALARRYGARLAGRAEVTPLRVRAGAEPSYHLYPVLLDLARLRVGREKVFAALRAEGVGVNVHYIPVDWHAYYQARGYRRGLCPVAEDAYERLLSLPLFPAMADEDVDAVAAALAKVAAAYGTGG